MGWMHVPVVDMGGHRASLDIDVDGVDIVEWRLGHRRLARVDRSTLLVWFRQGSEQLRCENLTLRHTPMGPFVEARGSLAPAPLMPVTFLDLRDRLLASH
jgi:hypothetical protein